MSTLAALPKRQVILTFGGVLLAIFLSALDQTTVSGYLGIGPQEERDYSEETARKIDEEIRVILENARQTVSKALADYKPRLVHLARKLLIKETLEGPELEATFVEPLETADTPAEGLLLQRTSP